MTGTPDDEGAFQLDLYLDRVLAGDTLPLTGRSSSDDPRLAAVAVLVADGAARFHPSPRFEERLARMLQTEGVGLDVGTDRPGIVLPFGPTVAAERARSRRVGGVIVGGAIASGVSLASLAGAAALMVWRRTRPDARWGRL